MMKKREVDVPERTARHRLQMAEELKPHPEMREKVKVFHRVASPKDRLVF